MIPKKKEKTVTQLKKIADDWMSLFIRARDKAINEGRCLICNIRGIEVNYHIFPRGNMATRYEARACVGSCSGCNFNEFINRTEANKARLRKRYVEILGEDLYEELLALSKSSKHYSKIDIIEIAATYKKMYEDIK